MESEVTFEKEFKVGDSRTSTIRLLYETEAWIRSDNLNKIVDDNGKIRRSLDSKCLLYNFAVSEDGFTYFCDPDDENVKQTDKDGKISTLFSVSPLIPSYINLTRSGDLLITLEEEDSYETNNSSRRLVRRATMTGEAIMEYEFDNDGKTPLFCRPMRPVEHSSGNICVINQFKREKDSYGGIVFRFDNKGKVLFRYSGQNENFNPVDICCDTEGNTFVSDCVNKQIHIIDVNGKFVSFLTKKPFNERILAIAIYDSRLWIGNSDNGIVKVFKIK